MIRFLFTLLSCLGVFGAGAVVIDMTPGNLADILNTSELDNSLVLKGEADARDFEVLRNLPASVSDIDMSDLKITAYYSETPFLANYSYSPDNCLPPYAFFMSKATRIILPVSLTAIGEGVFSNSAVAEVLIPEGVAEFGDYAFFNAKNIENIVLPKSLYAIGARCFEKCGSLKSIDVSNTRISVVSDRCFALCGSLKEISLPSSCGRIGDEAFNGSALATLNSPDVIDYGSFVFANCNKLTRVTLNQDASFGKGLFMNCISLKEINGAPVYLPDLFAPNCPGIVVADFIENASHIGDFAFANNAATTLILSENLQFIGEGAFADIPGITEINAVALRSNVPETDDDAFYGVNTSTIMLVVDGKYMDIWKSHPVWRNFQISGDSDGVDDVYVSSAGITINVINGEIVVSASETIENLYLYSVNGTLLAHSSPMESECVVNIRDFAESGNIIIVCVKTASDYRAAKIII